jgi:hypothetical protein
VGVGTQGLGASCEHQLTHLSRDRYLAWKTQKDTCGAGRPPPKAPPVDCKAFYDRSKVHHEEVLSALKREKERAAVEFLEERKNIRNIVHSAKQDAESQRRRRVQEEKDRRKLLKELALENAAKEKEKAIMEEKEKVALDRDAWREQHDADLEIRSEIVDRTKMKRNMEKSTSEVRKQELERERLAAIEAERCTMKARREGQQRLIEDNVEGRKQDVSRLHDMEKRSKERLHDFKERKKMSIRQVIQAMQTEQKAFQTSRKGLTNEAGAEAAKKRKENEARVATRIEMLRAAKAKHAQEWKENKKVWMNERLADRKDAEAFNRMLVHDVKSPRYSPRHNTA